MLVLGLAMLSVPLAVIFVALSRELGVRVAGAIFAVTAVVLAWMCLAVWVINNAGSLGAIP